MAGILFTFDIFIYRFINTMNNLRRLLPGLAQQSKFLYAPKRSIQTSLIEARPYKFNWGVIPVVIVSVPCMYIGAVTAKRGAEFLEEWNIFVVEDEDD